MTELDNIETDKKGASSRLKRFFRLGFLMAIAGLALGNSNCPGDGRPATLVCREFSIHVDRGTCTVFPNPCSDDGEWAHRPSFDGIRLEPTEEQQGQYEANDIHLVTTRVGDETTRSLCIAPDARHFVSQRINFLYGLNSQYGTSTMFVNTAAQCECDRHAFNNRARPELSTSRDC